MGQALGGTPEGATADPQVALTPPADAKAGAIIDPGIWLVECFVLAQNAVYVTHTAPDPTPSTRPTSTERSPSPSLRPR